MKVVEARRNPNINKDPSFDEFLKNLLKKYSKKDIFVSFKGETDNIWSYNPDSTFETPIGLYVYPLSLLIEEQTSPYNEEMFREAAPFAGELPYIYFFILQDWENIITSKTTKKIFKEYVKKVQTLYKKNKGIDEICKKFLSDNYTIKGEFLPQVRDLDFGMDFQDEKAQVIIKRAVRELIESGISPMYYFYNFLEHVVYYLTGKEKNPAAFTNLCLKIGIHGFLDLDGEGMIHYFEPEQGVFFKVKSIGELLIYKVPRNKDGETLPEEGVRVLKSFPNGAQIVVAEQLRRRYYIPPSGKHITELHGFPYAIWKIFDEDFFFLFSKDGSNLTTLKSSGEAFLRDFSFDPDKVHDTPLKSSEGEKIAVMSATGKNKGIYVVTQSGKILFSQSDTKLQYSGSYRGEGREYILLRRIGSHAAKVLDFFKIFLDGSFEKGSATPVEFLSKHKHRLLEQVEVLFPKGGNIPGTHKKPVSDKNLHRTGFNPGRANRVKKEKNSQQIERYLGDGNIPVENLFLVKELIEKGKKLKAMTSGDSYQEKDLLKQHLLEVKEGMRDVLKKLPAGFHEKWRISPKSNLQELTAFLIFLPQLENNLEDLREYIEKESAF